jgi:protein-S-isoprenylcysteine O-methyltransferase Ste14
MTHLSFSGTRLGGWYFACQGLAVVAWWGYLAVVPAARSIFLPPGASDLDLLAFRLPDLLVIVPASLIAAAAILSGRTWALVPAWASAGAMVYAFVYCVAWSVLREGGWINVVLMAPAALLSTVSALDVSATALAVFRRAAPADSGRYALMTLGQIAIFWPFFLFLVPAVLVVIERRLAWPWLAFQPVPIAALLMFVGFSALGLASGLTMATRGSGTPLPFAAPNRLVTSGPYAYVRNPMMIAGLGQGMAVALWLGSWGVVTYVLLGGAIWQLLVRPAEERDLHQAFGADFATYSQKIRCWFPRREAYVPPDRRVTKQSP